MNIIYITDTLSIGGQEILIVNYLTELKKRGHNVCLVQTSHTENFLIALLRENDVKVRTLFDFANINMLVRIVNRIRREVLMRALLNEVLHEYAPDVVHIHAYRSYIGHLDFPNNRTFFSFHTQVDRVKGALRNKFFWLNLKYFISKGGSVIAISDDVKFDTMKHFPDAKVYVVYNGIDIEKVRFQTKDRCKFLSSIRLSGNEFVVGHVGRFDPVKNHEKVITIFAEIVRRKENAVLLLVGGGDGTRVRKIKSLVAERGIENKVRFLGVRPDATAIMSVFDAFILPSHVEGFSLVLAEAQVHGIRCVATDTVPDVVVANANCFKLSSEASDEEWAKLVLDDNVRDSVGDLSLLDISTSVSKLEKIYSNSL